MSSGTARNRDTITLLSRYLSWITRILLCFASLTLAACGGDSPTLVLTIQSVKIFHFNWNNVSGATEYRLLENPDGVSGYTELGTIDATVTSVDLEVSLPARINARYILQACNNAECVDSNEVSVSGNLAEAVGYFKASNTGADDAFGSAVALATDGNTLAIGARGEASNAVGINDDQSDDSMANSGAVYIFTRDNSGNWNQQAYIKASNTGLGDAFGSSIALAADGNTLAVGAPLEDSNATGIFPPVSTAQANDAASDSGAVYVFNRDNNGNWNMLNYIKASNTGAGDTFGSSVALTADGITLAVGAPGEASSATGINDPNQGDDSMPNSGAVYIFDFDGTVWSQSDYLKASNTESDDRFGNAVALAADGIAVAVGAPGEDGSATGIDGIDDNLSTDSGAAYVFVRGINTWSQEAYVKASNTGTGDAFGISVALNEDAFTLAVGAWREGSSATGVDGDQANDAAVLSGAVYVFAFDGGLWGQQAYIKASNTVTGDAFGATIALSTDGNTLAVGAFGEDSDATGINGDENNDASDRSGAVYVFDLDKGAWNQQAYVKGSNTGTRDAFGVSLGLTSDGSTLAVGASGEDSSATGINGDSVDDSAIDSGAVYVF